MTRAHADFTARLHAGEYGDYAAYLAEHPLTTPTPAPAESTATPTPAPESR